MRALIVNIGDELLIGQTINTNASWMGEQLDLNGIKVIESKAIADDKIAIVSALNLGLEMADVVLITGGLGPTKDDITKHTLCEFFDSELELNHEVLDGITKYFESKNRPMLQVNKDQALLPKKCDVLINTKGTASGMWFEQNETVFVSMPGVPYEMKYLMEAEVLPRLHKITNRNIYHQTVKTIGIGESYLAKVIEDWESSLTEKGVKLAYLPSPGEVKLRLSIYDGNPDENKSVVRGYIEQLHELIPEYIYGYNKDHIAEIVGRLLKENNASLGVCESCTGGYLSHLITSISGSSQYYNGSVVSYSNGLKNELLKVPLEVIEENGAVSEAVVRSMAKGGLNALQCDYSIAISGVAGPTGGTDIKPVGTVCIAVASRNEEKTFTFNFGNDRGRNIHMSAIYSLNELRKMLQKH